jgi:uncharacterized membrane protein AbrB (regulator of aidB expression)
VSRLLWFVAAVVTSVVLSVAAIYVIWRSDTLANCTVTYPAVPGHAPQIEAC